MSRLLSYFIILLFVTSAGSKLFAQKKDTLTVAFWNTENLFDIFDDKDKNDEDFLPTSKKQWTLERYNTKLQHLAQVIKDMNTGRGPDVLGLAELENKKVVEDLVNPNLDGMEYQIVHYNSPDQRGISVALLFKSTVFELLGSSVDTVHLSTNHPTRLILHAMLLTRSKDTLNFFVNHWPSRVGGQDESESYRISAAQTLRSSVDKLLAGNPASKIIIMGDFNDEPDNKSIAETLGAEHLICGKADPKYSLHNLAWTRKSNGEGTLSYRGQWNMLDQIIVSSGLLNTKSKSAQAICESFEIFKPDYLVQKDEKYKGSPFPTYGGNKYLGGYSDHFSVNAKIVINSKKVKK